MSSFKKKKVVIEQDQEQCPRPRKKIPKPDELIKKEKEKKLEKVKELLKKRYGDPPYPPMAFELAVRDLGYSKTTWHNLGRDFLTTLTEENAFTYFDWDKYKDLKKSDLPERKVVELKPQPGPQTQFLSNKADIIIFGGGAGSGKACVLTERINTLDGWKTYADISVGDKVFGVNGETITVTELHPIEECECYRVFFMDGGYIDCSANHLWRVYDLEERKEIEKYWLIHKDLLGEKGQIISTEGLFKRGLFINIKKKMFYNYGVPVCRPLQYPETDANNLYHKGVIIANKLDKIENVTMKLKYIRSSYMQRLQLVNGIMDTKGSMDRKKDLCKFVCKNASFMFEFRELLLSLGIKVPEVTEIETRFDEKTVYEYKLEWFTQIPMFKWAHPQLKPRKKLIPGDKNWWIIEKIKPIGKKEARCITVSAEDGIYLTGDSFIPTHNSFSLLLDPLRYVNNPEFGAVIFRRTYPEIKNEGGLWDEAIRLYLPLGAKPRETDLSFTFPSGAAISFAHLQYEKNIYNWQGSQIPYLGFDEITHFTSKQFWYLMSRQRNIAGLPNLVRATCNPDPDSFIRKVIKWWIGPSGYPIPERSGIIRWFVRDGEDLKWSDKKESLEKKYPDLIPRSLTFIPAKLTDNKILMERSPEYMATLMSLPLVDRARLLEGNWDVRATAGLYFKAYYFDIVEKDALPPMRRVCRGWDLAGTSKKEQNVSGEIVRQMDATAGIKMGLGQDGFYYIIDMVYGRFSPYEVENYIYNCARQDGVNTVIRLPQDPGQAGKAQIAHFAKKLAGFRYRTRVMTGDKVTRAGALSSAAEHGLIRIVKGTWNDVFLENLEAFPPQIGSPDIVDATVEAFHELTDANINVARIIPISVKM